MTSPLAFPSVRASTTCRRSSAPTSLLKRLLRVGPESSPGQNKHISEHHLPQQAMTRALLPATAARKAYCNKPQPLHTISKPSQPHPEDRSTQLGCLLLLVPSYFFTCATIITACFHPWNYHCLPPDLVPWLCR